MKPRTVERSRLVPHTVDGHTELVLDRYQVEIPLPPRDWDRLVLSAVTAGAGLLVTVSVIWSTASIGDLLSHVVIAPAAYGAAVAFDVTWILCMAVEWLARYDQRRATLPRVAGHLSLLVAMSAVAAHGSLFGQPIIGAVGAAVSALAKGASMIVMRFHSRPLDDRTQQWVDKRRGDLNGQLAMIPIRRELQRAKCLVDAEAAALADGQPPAVDPAERAGAPAAHPEMRDPRPGASPDAPQVKPLRVSTEPITKTAAILAASAALQDDASPASIAHLLAQQGLAVDTAYIRTVLSREKQKAQTTGSEGYL